MKDLQAYATAKATEARDNARYWDGIRDGIKMAKMMKVAIESDTVCYWEGYANGMRMAAEEQQLEGGAENGR